MTREQVLDLVEMIESFIEDADEDPLTIAGALAALDDLRQLALRAVCSQDTRGE